MTVQEIGFDEIPGSLRAHMENVAIYQAAKRLITLGAGRAIKIRLEGRSAQQVTKKAHVFYRFRQQKLRTRTRGGFVFMWLEDKTPARFEVVGIPANLGDIKRAGAGK